MPALTGLAWPANRVGPLLQRPALSSGQGHDRQGNMMTSEGRHVVFIHGLWLHADSWTPWTELFREAGYAPAAPGWPGAAATVEESRNHPDQVAGKGINDVVEHYAQFIRGLDTPPIVI